MKRIVLILYLVAVTASQARTQGSGSFEYAELQLNKQLEAIRKAVEDSSRKALNDQFAIDFERVLATKGSYTRTFDSLKGITCTASPDGRFRFFTWSFSSEEGRFRYTGILQTAPKQGDSSRIIRLNDAADSVPEPGRALLPPDRWYGAVYYQVIPVRQQAGATYYTLLGWRGIDALVSSRLIDVLSFQEDGSVVFGARIFCEKNRLDSCRIIFRYSAKASMVLSYEKQSVVTASKWNASKRAFETQRIRQMMIVCDRIVPMDPQMTGRYEYYVPASDVMDGFVYSDGCWSRVTGVDARNPYQKPKPPPQSHGQ